MKRWILRGLAVALVICMCANQTPYRVEASSATRHEIEEAEKEKQQLEEDLKEADEKIDDLSGKQASLKKEIKSLNGNLEEISATLEDLQQQISVKEEEIATTEAELEEASTRETSQYEAMMKRIKFMYEDSQTLYMEILFQAKSFSELITLSNYVDELASYDKIKFDEYQKTRIEIEDMKAKLQSERVELGILEGQAQAEKEKLIANINETAEKVKKYEGLIDDAEAAYLEKEKELDKANENLEALQKKLAEEIRLSQLSANAVWRDISDVTFDDGDRYLLANLIYCEAGGESYEGQVAVGAVVINRLRSPLYPSTVSGVIYQKSQFSPAGSGRLAYALSVNKATDSCYRAADAAMGGASNVGNCVYFRTPIPGLSGIQIGNHIFY